MRTVLRFHNDHQEAHDEIMDDLVREIPGLRVMNINIESNPHSANENNIRFCPSYILIIQGKEVTRREGDFTFEDLKEWLINEPGNI